jgi:hypothetical protein
MGLFCLRVMQDREAEITQELQPLYNYPPWSGSFSEMYALTLAAAGRTTEARAVAAQPHPIRRDMFWLFMTGVRGLLAIAIDDRDRAEFTYKALLPYAGRPAGADTGAITLGPAAQILGDLARYLGLPGADAHYRHALAVAGQAQVEQWREAAMRRLD